MNDIKIKKLGISSSLYICRVWHHNEIMKNKKLVNNDFNKKVMEHYPFVKTIAKKICRERKLPYSIELDDLISAGVIGLMDAIEKYDPSRDNKFKTYAEFRIRGAILDELRSQDWVPRSVRDKAKKIDRTYQELEQRYGRTVSDSELSEALGMEISEYYQMVGKVKAVTLLSIDELSGPSNNDKKSLLECLESGPSNNLGPRFGNDKTYSTEQQISLFAEEESLILQDIISTLPLREAVVINDHYYHETPFKKISKELRISASMVTIIHKRALVLIKKRLQKLK